MARQTKIGLFVLLAAALVGSMWWSVRREVVTRTEGETEARSSSSASEIELAAPPARVQPEDELAHPGSAVGQRSSIAPDDLVLRADARGVLRGRVLAPGGAEGAARARVSCSIAYTGLQLVETAADGSGEFAFEDLPVETPLNVWVFGERARRALSIGRLRAREVRQVEIQLEAWPDVHGVVWDEFGTPIAGAEVTVSRVNVDALQKRSAVTGADGRFRLSEVEPDNFRIEVESSGRDHLVRSLELPADGRSELVFVLGIPGFVRGRVTGPDGQPVAQAKVEAIELPPAREASDPPELSIAWYFPVPASSSCVTDAGGRFTLLARSGSLLLRARAEGLADSALLGLTLPSGGEREDVELVLRPACRLKGRAMDDRDAPLRVVLRILPAEGLPVELASDANGYFLVPVLPPGRVRVGPMYPSFHEGSVECVLVPERQGEVELRLKPVRR